ncbi:MAG: hypothetical protein WCP45_03745 [Verrucomicrobiota bacterium]
MNTPRPTTLVRKFLECLLLAGAAGLLLRATWLPVIEIKGFDTFTLETVAMWATRAARVILGIALGCLLLRPLTVARWWMALAVGILLSPLADMAIRAQDLTQMMKTSGTADVSGLIVLRAGAWVCLAGLALWLLDIVRVVGAALTTALGKPGQRAGQ